MTESYKIVEDMMSKDKSKGMSGARSVPQKTGASSCDMMQQQQLAYLLVHEKSKVSEENRRTERLVHRYHPANRTLQMAHVPLQLFLSV